MNRGKFTKAFKKEDGAGLVLALMVLMVLAVLGVAVAGVTIGSHKLGHISRDSNSAYYIAEAGANLAYEEIKSGVMPAYANSNNNESIYFTNIAEMIAAYNPEVYAEETFERQLGSQPKATVTVSGPKDSDGGKRYIIESIGEIDGKTRSVEKEFLIKWVPTTLGEMIPSTPPDSAIVVRNTVELTGSSRINGDVHADSKVAKSFVLGSSTKVNGTIFSSYEGNLNDIIDEPDHGGNRYKGLEYHNSDINWSGFESMLEMIKLPENWGEYKKINSIFFNWETQGYIGENTYAKEIHVNAGDYLEIDNVGRDINIVVDSLKVLGSRRIVLLGDGHVNIFVREHFKLSGSSRINANGDRSNLRIYYFGGSKLEIGGSTLMNGNLLVEKAELKLGGSGNVTGAVVSGGYFLTLEGAINDNIMVVIPYGNTVISGSSNVQGIIVCDSIKLIGSAKVTFDTFDSGILFPNSGGSGSGPGSPGPGSAPTLADLISAGPALEP